MTYQDRNFWKQAEASLKSEPNPEWIELLRYNLQACHPEKLAELVATDDLETYLKVRVNSAGQQFQTMLDARMDE